MSEELQKQYYLVKFKVLQETYYTIWYTDDIDGFLLDKDSMLRSFPTKEKAIAGKGIFGIFMKSCFMDAIYC